MVEPKSDVEVVRTDEELVAKARGQLDAVVATLQELAAREVRIDLQLGADDADQWFHRLTVSRTEYL